VVETAPNPSQNKDKSQKLSFAEARAIAFRALDKAERLQHEFYERERQESQFWEER